MDRFWSKVNKDADGGCWVWTAYKNRKGYGEFSNKEFGSKLAHRVSWEMANGPIPAGDSFHGMCVLHKCDNPPCVNPDHLFLGTHKENMDDMVRKGRDRKALNRKNGRARISSFEVSRIRGEWASGRISQKELGERYGVSPSYVCRLVNGERRTKLWKSYTR